MRCLSLLIFCSSFLSFDFRGYGQHGAHGQSSLNESYDTVSVKSVADQLVSPLLLTEAPDNSNRLFVVDQPGKIYIIKNGKKLEQPFLSITNKIAQLSTTEEEERGLLGLAFHPKFKDNGKFYIFYSAPLQSSGPKAWDHTNRVSEFKVAPGADIADSASERIILQIDHPQMNHNAGMLAFGQDGYLYISVGDGGGADDTYDGHVEDWYSQNKGGNAQNVEKNLLGKILRIDINGGNPYGIPPDNPFANGGGMKEIYAYGFRNPYRFCFDPANKDQLIVADAGQELYEEIDVVKKGGNYGWNVKEGKHCFSTANNKQAPDKCPPVDAKGNRLIDPVLEFKNSMSFDDGLGVVSIGGFVYRGTTIHQLQGKYLFGAWTTTHESGKGAVYAATQSGTEWKHKKLWISGHPEGQLNLYLLGFGQDSKGEVYLLASNELAPNKKSGRVLKLTPFHSMDHAQKAPQRKARRVGPVVEYNLFVNDTTVNFTGRKRKALAINGQIPAPTIRFTEGDSAVIHVHNGLRSEVSIHWHGVLLPNEADGVPYLTTPPIKAGQTHTFRFRVIQHGTLWYHSHSMEQEQEGLYGPLVFNPADGMDHASMDHASMDHAPNEEVLQISDWRDERGKSILRTLKRRNEWYAIKKKSVQSWGEAIVKGHFSDKVQMEWMRMPGADVSDIYYTRFLMHGQPVRIFNKYKRGDSVKLRVINGSAATYFWLQYSGGKMKVIAADGNDVMPVEVDKLLIATAETYDIMIQIPDSGQYEFRATSQDIVGHASAFFGSGSQVKAKDIPPLDYMVLMNEMNQITWMMKGMGMKMRMGLFMKMPEMDMNNMGGMQGMPGMDHNMPMNMDSMDHEKMNMKDTAKLKMDDMDHSKMPGMDTVTEKKKPAKTTAKPTTKKPAAKKPAKKKPAPKKPEKEKPVDHSKHGTSSIHQIPPDNFGTTTGLSTVSMRKTSIVASYLQQFIADQDTVPRKKESMSMPMNEHTDHQQKKSLRDTVPAKKGREMEMKKDPHAGMNNMQGMQMNSMQQDTSRSAMLMNMMPRKKMTGFDFPPGNGDDVVLSYDMLVSDTGSTVLPAARPWREVNLTLSGNMQRFVWSVNGKTLSQQDEKVLIRKGENVRLVFTNATMMEHPMHLHGHFFRVINKQGGYAPMKHTFNINAMSTQVIEFAATEEKDWFLHCHTLYHMVSGMATIISYEGTESQVQQTYHHGFKMFKKEHGSMLFAWANASAHSQGTFGTVVLSGLKFQLDQDWRWNWKKSYELETRLQYFLDKRQFFSVFAGAEFERTDVKNGKKQPQTEQDKIAAAGIIYTLPFLVNAEARIDHKGNFRFQLRREDLPLTTRTRLDFSWNTDKEYGIELRYIVAKYLAVSANYDSDYGWGAGLSIIY